MKGQAGSRAGPGVGRRRRDSDLVGGGRDGAVCPPSGSPPPTPDSVRLKVLAFPALQRPPRLWCVPQACPSGLASRSRPHADGISPWVRAGGSAAAVGPFAAHPSSPGPCLPPALPPGPAVNSPGQWVGQLGPQPRLSAAQPVLGTALSRGTLHPGAGVSLEPGLRNRDGVGLGSPLTFNPRRPTLSLSHALLFGRASPLSPPTDTSSLKLVPDSPTWSRGTLLWPLLPG